MKKLISIFLVAMLCMSLVVVAADDAAIVVDIKDIANDIITVSGSAAVDEVVTVYILNPGKTETGVSFGPSQSDAAIYQFFGTTLSKGGKYEVDVKIVPVAGTAGGTYTIYVISGGKLTSTSYTFYSYSKKQEFVSVLKQASNADELSLLLPQISEVFGLSGLELYKNENITNFARAICDINQDYKLQTPEEAAVLLYDALVLSALNSDNEKLFKNNSFEFWNSISVKDDTLFGFYSDINPEGKNIIKGRIFAASYKKIKDFYDLFRELTLVYGITESSLGGSGHVETYFSTYENDYKNAGFKFDEFENYENKKTVYAELVKSGASSLVILAEDFNNAIKPEEEEEDVLEPQPSTGGGGFSGGSSGGSAGGTGGAASSDNKPSDYVTGTDEVSNPTVTYVDVADSKWYYEPISKLTALDIISGYPGGRFEPNKSVTRAELMKMLSIAFELKVGSETVSFSDVSVDIWYAPYINTAASLGVFRGSEGYAYPNINITREDAAVLLYRILNLKNTDFGAEKNFDDSANMAEYSKDAISKLGGFGVLNGNGTGNFLPKSTITRAEAAQMIYSAMEKTGGFEN